MTAILLIGYVYTIVVDGKEYFFELPAGCALCCCTRQGEERKTRWPQAVWRAVEAWSDQGKKHRDGLCEWRDPKVPDALLQFKRKDGT